MFAAACAVVVVLAIVGAVRRLVNDHHSDPLAARPVVADGEMLTDVADADARSRSDPLGIAGPASVSAGIPAGFAPTAEGARVAAVGWVASLPALLRLGPIRVEQTLTDRLSQRAVAAGVIGQVSSVRDDLSSQLGADLSRFTVTESPLTVNGELTSASSAVVSVWSAFVTASTPDAPVEVQYRTHRLSLVWEADDWRLDDLTVAEGPTPVTVAGQAPTGFVEYVTVAGWVPATAAGIEQE